MTRDELEDILSNFDQAIGYIQRAIEKLEDVDRVRFIDVSGYMDRLMEIGGDLELELDSMEDEVTEDE